VHRMGRSVPWDTTMPTRTFCWTGSRARRAYDAVWGHYLFPADSWPAWFARLNGIPAWLACVETILIATCSPPAISHRLQWNSARGPPGGRRDARPGAESGARRGRTTWCACHAVGYGRIRAGGRAPDWAKLRDSSPMRRLLGFAGGCAEKKGQRVTEALRQVQASRPRGLLIIGEVRPLEAPLGNLEEQRHPDHRAAQEPAE